MHADEEAYQRGQEELRRRGISRRCGNDPCYGDGNGCDRCMPRSELEILLAKLVAKYKPVEPPSPDRIAFIEARRALPCEQPADASGRLTLRCSMCQNPFEREPRSEEELEYIRRSLLITSHCRPAICDNCLGLHEHWRREAQGPRGEKFHDSPNFLLRHQARWPNGEPR